MTEQGNSSVNCWIYSSARQDQMYLYMHKEDDFDSLPKDLMLHFGKPSLVMELTLHDGQKLAREDVHRVMDNLKGQGYHLQMPPKIDVELNSGE